MNSTLVSSDLAAIAANWRQRCAQVTHRLVICGGTGCIANGALKLRDALLEACAAAGLRAEISVDQHDCDQPWTHISKSGCQGFCAMGPLLGIDPGGLLYCKVRPEDAEAVVRETLIEGRIVERLCWKDPQGKTYPRREDIPFYAAQKRSLLAAGCRIDPDDIAEYIADGGYEGARKAWLDMPAADVLEQVQSSGLRGRGGGGFPTGRKWAFAAAQDNPVKYVICNGDEGDPGAFMDRSIMEGNPHAVLEGMLIAGRAIGAHAGYVYVRAEYPLAVQRMRTAVTAAVDLGILGDDAFGSGQAFHITVKEGAGAFVCGEETALIASIEGRRGMPAPKPPFPAVKGLYGKPTVINNVETLAMVPDVLGRGADAFRTVGTQRSPGTKTFALTGHVANTGLIEVPFGITLREIVFGIGGGVTAPDGSLDPDGFKAVQIGGPSGGCLVEEHLDVPLDYDSLRELGAMVGSGGLVVMNRHTCMVEVAQFFMQFTQNESCGKCTLCREGTRQLLGMLERIIAGSAEDGILDSMKELAEVVAMGSLCGLGKTAPSPVLSTMRLFREEYEAHVFDKRCPAGVCTALLDPEIDAEKCKGCTVCIKVCPVGAISGERKQAHRIDPELCIKCSACASKCRFDAISGVGAA